jgi:hypothetical protein
MSQKIMTTSSWQTRYKPRPYFKTESKTKNSLWNAAKRQDNELKYPLVMSIDDLLKDGFRNIGAAYLKRTPYGEIIYQRESKDTAARIKP